MNSQKATAGPGGGSGGRLAHLNNSGRQVRDRECTPRREGRDVAPAGAVASSLGSWDHDPAASPSSRACSGKGPAGEAGCACDPWRAAQVRERGEGYFRGARVARASAAVRERAAAGGRSGCEGRLAAGCGEGRAGSRCTRHLRGWLAFSFWGHSFPAGVRERAV